jgi:hypothetical protein
MVVGRLLQQAQSFLHSRDLLDIWHFGGSETTYPVICNGTSRSYFVNAFASTMLGDLVFPMALLLAYNVHKSLSSEAKWINENLKNNRFVTWPIFIRKNYSSSETPRQPDELDKEYSNRYIKPVMLKTAQLGYDLSFDKKYQVGSGIIGSSLALSLVYLRFVSSVLPPSAALLLPSLVFQK